MKTTEDQIVKIAKALADKTRVKILQQIAQRGSMTCGEAEGLASLSQPTISHHLKVLADAELIVTEKNGRHVTVSVNKNALKDFIALLPNSGVK